MNGCGGAVICGGVRAVLTVAGSRALLGSGFERRFGCAVSGRARAGCVCEGARKEKRRMRQGGGGGAGDEEGGVAGEGGLTENVHVQAVQRLVFGHVRVVVRLRTARAPAAAVEDVIPGRARLRRQPLVGSVSGSREGDAEKLADVAGDSGAQHAPLSKSNNVVLAARSCEKNEAQ